MAVAVAHCSTDGMLILCSPLPKSVPFKHRLRWLQSGSQTCLVQELEDALTHIMDVFKSSGSLESDEAAAQAIKALTRMAGQAQTNSQSLPITCMSPA